ncbi:MAG TPA: hypothetical protein VGW78_00940 [Candidatus Babeliales bacterium]|nr:hypothetical protein [Candidatus Babeliales bacterium]
MCHSHMDATEAVKAFKILNAKLFVPMHWGTFGLGPDSFDTPIKMLDNAWQQLSMPQSLLYKIKFGERLIL